MQLSLKVNGELVDAMTTTVHRGKALRIGKELAEKLRKILPRQQFQVRIDTLPFFNPTGEFGGGISVRISEFFVGIRGHS